MGPVEFNISKKGAGEDKMSNVPTTTTPKIYTLAEHEIHSQTESPTPTPLHTHTDLRAGAWRHICASKNYEGAADCCEGRKGGHVIYQEDWDGYKCEYRTHDISSGDWDV